MTTATQTIDLPTIPAGYCVDPNNIFGLPGVGIYRAHNNGLKIPGGRDMLRVVNGRICLYRDTTDYRRSPSGLSAEMVAIFPSAEAMEQWLAQNGRDYPTGGTNVWD